MTRLKAGAEADGALGLLARARSVSPMRSARRAAAAGVAEYASGVAMAQAGNIDEAFVHLDRVTAQRAGQAAFLKVDPSFDPLHGDPRWDMILRRIGLAPAVTRDEHGMSATRLFLVRHGATELTAEDRFAGATDVDLSDEGRAQATRLAERLRDDDVAAVYCSPLRRTRETAALIAAPHGAHPARARRACARSITAGGKG